MNTPATRMYMDSFICPACQSANLLLTKEKIIICQECLNGYRMIRDIPDFRLENAISFKKKISSHKKGLKAVLMCLSGEQVTQSRDVSLGHCVVLGRRMNKAAPDEGTFVGRPTDKEYTQLGLDSQHLIEKCLSNPIKTNTNIKVSQDDRQSALNHEKKLLGNFIRDYDVLLEESSVSRTHAVVFQDEDGVHIIDLVSKNGTYVNGREVERQKLKNNDTISLGKSHLCLRVS